MKKKTRLCADDVENIKITEVLYKETGFTKDIIMEFPDDYEIPRISFIEAGLINAKPEVTDYEADGFPKVTIDFYGKLEKIEE